MVWAGSQKFGCGKARSSNGKVVINLFTYPQTLDIYLNITSFELCTLCSVQVIVVAYYHPRGNVPDKYHLNVVQPSSTDADNQKYAKLL